MVIGWHYNPAAANLDWLGQGDTLTITFVAQVDDGHGNVGAQNLVITITGTNDVPTVTAAVAEGTVTEDVAPTTASGTINFADVDLSDLHTVSVTGNATDGYLGTLSASITNDSTGDGIGYVTWNFSVDNADLQFLNGGQTLTQTYTVTINDGHTGTVSQNITITLVGADDSDPNDFDWLATGDHIIKIDPYVFGTPGADSIAGGGDDPQIIYGGAGDDTINGTGESDFIFGGSGNDTIKGNGDNDVIYGGSGRDTIDGSNGNDVIIGGYGGDQLTGGNGSDTFMFLDIKDSQPGTGQFDVIKDFTHNSDHLDLTAIAGATNVQGLVGSAGTVAANSISWFVDNTNNQTIVYVNTTGTANHVDMEIHLTGTNINLSGSDILHHT
jgi:VCBS repeat-containing protein